MCRLREHRVNTWLLLWRGAGLKETKMTGKLNRHIQLSFGGTLCLN